MCACPSVSDCQSVWSKEPCVDPQAVTEETSPLLPRRIYRLCLPRDSLMGRASPTKATTSGYFSDIQGGSTHASTQAIKKRSLASVSRSVSTPRKQSPLIKPRPHPGDIVPVHRIAARSTDRASSCLSFAQENESADAAVSWVLKHHVPSQLAINTESGALRASSFNLNISVQGESVSTVFRSPLMYGKRANASDANIEVSRLRGLKKIQTKKNQTQVIEYRPEIKAVGRSPNRQVFDYIRRFTDSNAQQEH